MFHFLRPRTGASMPDNGKRQSALSEEMRAAVQFARLNDITVHYQTIGTPGARPALVFANSLGSDFRIWRDVVVRLAGDYVILNYDMRGHGLTDTGAAPCTIEMLGSDLAALMDHVGIRSATVCGVSLGGLVAQQLYASRPDLVDSLILSDTAAKIGDAGSWRARIAAIEAGGMEAIAEGVLARWFSGEFRSARKTEYAGYRNMLIRQPVDGYIAACEALARADLTAAAAAIEVPTICVVGEQDTSTPPDIVAALARSIPGARYQTIADCGHLPSIEQPEVFVAILRAHLAMSSAETVSHVSH
jgi:3-oxoadipate enol-lactonase